MFTVCQVCPGSVTELCEGSLTLGEGGENIKTVGQPHAACQHNQGMASTLILCMTPTYKRSEFFHILLIMLMNVFGFLDYLLTTLVYLISLQRVMASRTAPNCQSLKSRACCPTCHQSRGRHSRSAVSTVQRGACQAASHQCHKLLKYTVRQT